MKAIPSARNKKESNLLSEKNVKRAVKRWLVVKKWNVEVAWRHVHGIDVEAHRGKERWVIEAKGCGSLNPMRVNYFLSILGELLQRMNDKNARYSIALPDIEQFKRLWERLPLLVKHKLRITALFVDKRGEVSEFY